MTQESEQKLTWNAEDVNGVAIVGVERAKSNLWTEESQIFHVKAVQLHLADETIVYGCTFEGCMFTSPSSFGVAGGHYKMHTPPGGPWGQYATWTLTQIFGRLADAEDDTKKLTERWHAAEARVEAMRTERAELNARIKELTSQVTAMQGAARKLLGTPQ